jgi:hypothetical protein
MPGGSSFAIDDASSFDSNLDAFCDSLASEDAALAASMKVALPKLLRGEISRAEFWGTLYAAIGGAS